MHLMVGLPCSGKTTLARQLERDKNALLLSPDPWQIGLFGQDANDPLHDERHTFIETMLWQLAKRALQLGTSVILDYGFWAREEREFFRQQARELGARSEIHYLDLPREELLRRLALRNASAPEETFQIRPESMEEWIDFFQKPDPDELLPREL